MVRRTWILIAGSCGFLYFYGTSNASGVRGGDISIGVYGSRIVRIWTWKYLVKRKWACGGCDLQILVHSMTERRWNYTCQRSGVWRIETNTGCLCLQTCLKQGKPNALLVVYCYTPLYPGSTCVSQWWLGGGSWNFEFVRTPVRTEWSYGAGGGGTGDRGERWKFEYL